MDINHALLNAVFKEEDDSFIYNIYRNCYFDMEKYENFKNELKLFIDKPELAKAFILANNIDIFENYRSLCRAVIYHLDKGDKFKIYLDLEQKKKMLNRDVSEMFTELDFFYSVLNGMMSEL